METTKSAPDISDPSLTINKRDLNCWLADFRDQMAAIKYMDGLCSTAYPKPRFHHLNYARATLKMAHQDTITAITRLGGLLLIGGAA